MAMEEMDMEQELREMYTQQLAQEIDMEQLIQEMHDHPFDHFAGAFVGDPFILHRSVTFDCRKTLECCPNIQSSNPISCDYYNIKWYPENTEYYSRDVRGDLMSFSWVNDHLNSIGIYLPVEICDLICEFIANTGIYICNDKCEKARKISFNTAHMATLYPTMMIGFNVDFDGDGGYMDQYDDPNITVFKVPRDKKGVQIKRDRKNYHKCNPRKIKNNNKRPRQSYNKQNKYSCR